MKRQKLAIIVASIALVYLCILWPLEAGAQDNPLPTPEISATWWVPTPTPLPTTRPLIVPCPPLMSCAWLPLVVTP